MVKIVGITSSFFEEEELRECGDPENKDSSVHRLTGKSSEGNGRAVPNDDGTNILLWHLRNDPNRREVRILTAN